MMTMNFEQVLMAYLGGFFALLAWLAYTNNRELGVRMAAVICFAWPLTIFVIALALAMEMARFTVFDVRREKRWQIRRTNVWNKGYVINTPWFAFGVARKPTDDEWQALQQQRLAQRFHGHKWGSKTNLWGNDEPSDD